MTWVTVPHDEGPTSDGTNRRLLPVTYSSELSLASLTFSHSTQPQHSSLTFHSHGAEYSIADVVKANDEVTPKRRRESLQLHSLGKRGHPLCPGLPAGRERHRYISYKYDDGNSVDPLAHAEVGTTDFQVDLDEGENAFTVHVGRVACNAELRRGMAIAGNELGDRELPAKRRAQSRR